jgi:rhodanese-related sulfurtransferase
VPLNMDGVAQSARLTTPDEFALKLIEAPVPTCSLLRLISANLQAGVLLPEDKHAAIITHCGSGGRGGRAAAALRWLGHTNIHNGGGPRAIAEALGLEH